MVRRAFTLVELLVVIGILITLISIVIPAVMAVKKGGEQHVTPPIRVSLPETQEIPLEKSGENRYYVRIESRRFLILVRDGKPEIHPCD